MPQFEILIPKSAKVPMNMTLRVEAESWIEALKAGRKKMGESGEISDNVLVDIKEDNSIHITDAGTGQVFRITELGGGPEPAPEPAPEPEPEIMDDAVTQPEMPAVQPEPEPSEAPTPHLVRQAAPEPEPEPAAKPEPAPAPEPSAPIGRTLEFAAESTTDYLAEIFEKTEGVYKQPGKEQALYFMLDLAMDKIQTDSGSVFLADINKHDLHFGAARGPKADEAMSFRMKMGQGIVGFCAEEGVGVAISDVTRDKRFYAAVSERIGYPTRSILCVPMEADGQVFGALELINRRENDTFTERDLNVANFIANQIAQYLLRQKS